MPAARRRAAASALSAAVLAATLGTAGCGAGNLVDPVAEAATVSTGAAGYTATIDMALSSPLLPKPIAVTGGGRYSVTGRSGTFSMRMTLPNVPALAQVVGGSALAIREVIAGTDVYLRLPGKLAGATGGKPWLRVDLARAGRAMPGGLGMLGSGFPMDPSQMLGYLRAISGQVTTVGPDTVAGVPTTHYRATIDLQKVAARAPASERSAAERSIAALEQMAHLDKLPVDVWIDAHHLVRRYSSQFAITVQSVPLTMTMTLRFPHYGPEPAAAPPPAGEVRTLHHMPVPGASGTAGAPTA